MNGPGGNCLSEKYKFQSCFAEERKIAMFDFVEQPVTIRNSEYPMYNDRPNRVVMQGGLQPVTAPL